MLDEVIGSCPVKSTRCLEDRKLLNHVFEVTEGVSVSMQDIMELGEKNPASMLYDGVKSDEEFGLRHQALRLCLNGQYEKSRDAASQALAINPESAYAYYIRGQANSNLCLWDEGIKDLENAIEKRPDYYRARLELGILYFNRGLQMALIRHKGKKEVLELTGDFKKAEKTLIDAIKTGPMRSQSYDLLGRIYYLTDRQYLAKKNLEKALELDPELDETRMLVERIRKNAERM